MAVLDPSSNTITLRIVYDGLGYAGKTTNVQKLYEANAIRRQSALITPELVRGRTAYFDWLELATGTLGDEYTLRCQVLTVPGQLDYAPRRWALLRNPDAIIAVCDSTPAGVTRAKLGMQFLRTLRSRGVCPDVPIVVQANKRDVEGAVPIDELREKLCLDADEDIVEAIASRGTGVQLTFIKALDKARTRVWRILETEGHAALVGEQETPDDLVRRLRVEFEAPDHAAYEVTDEVLREAFD
jgi:signal recognition particle receptor subunit beta